MATTNIAGKLRVGALETVDPLVVTGETVFDEVFTAEAYPIIELDSSNGLSTVYRDTVTTANSGSVTNTNGEHKVSTGATASSTAALRTSERGRYQPGVMGQAGVSIRRPTAPTGNQEIRWGYFDDNDGFMFGEDSSGLFVRHRHNGTDEDKVYQKNWNVDRLDGTGDSGVKLDPTKHNIYRIPFAWYGSGPAIMEILVVDTANGHESKKVTVHRFDSPNGELLIGQPKLPINVETDNGGDTKDISVFVGGRQFHVIGRYAPNRRQTPQENTAVTIGTTETPLVSFKKKTDSVNQPKSGKIGGLGVISDSDAVISIFLNPTLSGETFTDVSGIDPSETAFEADTSATSLSGGTIIDKALVSGGQGNSSNLAGIRALGVDIPDNVTVTLSARTVAGSGSASAVFTIEEEW